MLIGRAAQGRPWIFDDINYYLEHGLTRPNRGQIEIKNILLKHVAQLHEFYGNIMGVRIARKHVAWYMKTQNNHQEFRKEFNRIESTKNQFKIINDYFKQNTNQGEKAA